jgi:metal-responsive CopG/Arc/MetJ family transcriptional regulator
MALRIATNLSLPGDLVAEMDAVAGRRGRSAFVEEAIRDRLKRERLRDALSRAAGAWPARDYPEFASNEAVVQWVRQRRTEQTTRRAPAKRGR